MAAAPSLPGRPDGATRVARTAVARADRRLLVAGLSCAALIALDVALVLENRDLTRRVEELSGELAREPRPPLGPGDPMPDLALFDARSRSVPLLDPQASLGTLLLVSSAGCDACANVTEAWGAVVRRCRAYPLRILELVVDADPSALPQSGPGRTVVAAGGDAWTLLGRIPGVPAALLVDAQGTVQRAFYGPSQPGLAAAVEELLD